jgi:histidinol-phosphate aminotransferase
MKTRVLKHLQDTDMLSYVNQHENMESEPKIILDCSLGVNPFGFSKRAIENFKNSALVGVTNYPEPGYKELKTEIANYWREVTTIDTQQVKLGPGSIGVLNLINKLLIDRDTQVLGYSPQFTGYVSNVKSYGGKYDCMLLQKENNYKFSAETLISYMDKKYKIVYIDNPNNPTGQSIEISEIEKIVRTAELMGIYVIIDEAYGDFMPKEQSAISLVTKYSNLYVARTFSKGIGLAGLRAGYMVCSEELSYDYEKVDIPFSVNNLGQCMIFDALRDQEFMNTSIEKVRDIKTKIQKVCVRLKILETDNNVPIMVLYHPDPLVDLYQLFQEHHINTVSGEGFMNLGKNYVRIRVPAETEYLLKIIGCMEAEMKPIKS